MLPENDPSRYAADPRTLRFRDPETERAWLDVHNHRAVPVLRLAIGALVAVVVITTAVEWVGFLIEGPSGIEAWWALLPWRVGGAAGLAVGFALTFRPTVVRHGQPVVAAFVAALAVSLIATQGIYGPWIVVAAAVFNLAITLAVVASGLLFVWVAPLMVAITATWLGVLTRWTENPFPLGFISVATLIALLTILHSRERAARSAWASGLQLEVEKARSEALLLNVLPGSIADRMRAGERLIADRHDGVAVVFADIVDFTPLSSRLSPEALVRILDDVFTRFDRIAEELDLEKIKTIGDAYMMAAGLPTERAKKPARALEAALRMRQAIADVNAEREIALDIRVGAHVGEVVAGVIGQSKFVYDLWGDVVNVASRMESTAPKGQIQVTDELRSAAQERFDFASRGEIEVKGKGRMQTWLLLDPSAPLFKILSRDAWQDADAIVPWAPIDLSDGFVHLSAADQVEETAALHFAGRDDLVLLEILPERLTPDSLRWETSRGGQAFPHVYGDVPIDAVGRTAALSTLPGATFPRDLLRR